jgi:MFS family permease
VVIAGAGFVVIERRAVEPVLPLRLFRDREFVLISIAGAAFGFAMIGVMTFVPLFQQAVQGASPTVSGLLLAPAYVALMVTNVVGGHWTRRTGRFRPLLLLGAAAVPGGAGLLATVEITTPPGAVAAALAVFGIGMGAMMQASFVFAIGRVQPEDRGVASATTTLVRSLGGALGVAAGGAFFAAHVGRSDSATHLDAAGVASGSAAAFLLCAGAGVVVLIASLFVRETPAREEATVAWESRCGCRTTSRVARCRPG